MPKPKASEWRAIIESMFHVINKAGENVPFKLNVHQARLDAELTGRDIIPKARQLGMSTYFLARFTAKCITKDNRRCVIISHEEEATKRLLERARHFISHLKLHGVDVDGEFEISTDTTRLSKAEIIFGETGSWFYIGTAGAKSFGRGDTITDLHCSEFAHWDKPQDLAKGLFGSVPDVDQGGEIFLESTGNGIANDFATRTFASIAGKSHWKTHFFSWQDEPDYTVKLSWRESKEVNENLDVDLDEERLKKDFKLTAGQLVWRRRKINDMNGDMVGFAQEFPMTVDECFQATGNTVFDRMIYRPLRPTEWIETKGMVTSFAIKASHPRPQHHYVLGVDSSGGLGLDSAVIQVGCIETNEQVAVWRSTRTPPDLLAHKVIEWSDKFNRAFASIESNNHGLTVLNELKNKKFPTSRLLKHRPPDPEKKEGGLMDLGFQTTTKTKPLAVGRLRTLLAEGFEIHDPVTYMECQAFVETPEGKLEAQQGAHDDHVMGLVMMAAAMRKAALKAKPEAPPVDNSVDPFTLEGILQRTDRGRDQTAQDIHDEYNEEAYADVSFI